jgi:xanthine dehydrogenase accessory factor
MVFGETPAALTLAALAGLTGFRARLIAQQELGSLEPFGPDTWCVVATMGHYDEDALEAALASSEAPVAMIASRRRGAAVLDALRARGVREAVLARVRTPTGRLRGATQEEIALLTLAELVGERRRAGLRPAPAVEAAPVFATDPVCGMAVEVKPGALRAELGGRDLYFCCSDCLASFQREPERYLVGLETVR